MAISGFVFAVIAAAFIVIQKSTDESTVRLSESQDEAVTSAFLVKDVQSASTIAPATASSNSSTSTQCVAATGTPVLTMSWVELLASGNLIYTVDYRYDSSATTLTRYACGSGFATATSNTLGSHLSASVAPVAACVPSCATPSTVNMTLTDAAAGPFFIKAARRLT